MSAVSDSNKHITNIHCNNPKSNLFKLSIQTTLSSYMNNTIEIIVITNKVLFTSFLDELTLLTLVVQLSQFKFVYFVINY